MLKKLSILLVVIMLTACSMPTGSANQTGAPTETEGAAPDQETPTQTPLPSDTPTLSPTDTPMPTVTPTFTSTFTPTLTSTPTETPRPTATPGNLRGKIISEQIACRFGPGAMYLFKYSVFQEQVYDIVGRMEYSSWILIQTQRNPNPCWVNGDHVEIRGDITYVDFVDPHIVLAWSPYYDALTGVSAERNGNVVTVFWNALELRAGDSSEQVPYVVEAWVCQNGEFVFAPVGAYSLAAEVVDEPGCDQESHARVFAAEKHGYTQWIEIDWPIAQPEP